jgi:hypothetical protein
VGRKQRVILASGVIVVLAAVSAADADFTIQSQQSLLTTATSVDKRLTELLASIAAISLLVGATIHHCLASGSAAGLVGRVVAVQPTNFSFAHCR